VLVQDGIQQVEGALKVGQPNVTHVPDADT
jgi:hypothetical protein